MFLSATCAAPTSGCYFESIGHSRVAGSHIRSSSTRPLANSQQQPNQANIMHSFGVYGKQTSGHFQSLAAAM